MEDLSKLQIGVYAYYDGSFEDDNGAIIEQLVINNICLCASCCFILNCFKRA